MEIYYGQDFVTNFGWVNKLPRRDTFPILEKYIEGKDQNYACILYGLRKTGKSVMMFQSMMEHLENSVYILCSKLDNLDLLSNTMRELRRKGYSNFYIDEVTSIPEFIDGGQFIADVYTGNGRVVLAGTDSLSFKIASHTSLSCRTILIHTTHISYREHSRLLGTCTLDEYARCGGILTNVREFSDYPLEAIAENIQNSLKNYEEGERFFALKSLYEENKLTSIIQKIIKNENHKFSLDVLQKTWNLSDLTQVRRVLQNDEAERYSMQINLEKLLTEVKKSLNIIEGQNIKYEVLYTINQYLQYMELIEPGLVLTQEDIINTKKTYEDIEKQLSWSERRKNPEGRWIFTQPGLRWAQVDALLKGIKKQMLGRNIFQKDLIDILFSAIRNNAMGNLMEEIIISETARSMNYQIPVFKYMPLDGDIDMVILKNDAIQLYEIKHTTIPKTGIKGAKRHINNNDTTKLLEEYFNREIDFRGVLYCGKTGEKHGFYNAEEYLLNLEPERMSIDDEIASEMTQEMRL